MESLNDEDVYKLEIEPMNKICRCCISTNRKMYNACNFQHYFMSLAGIDVSISDGLPQWICYECLALLTKAANFKCKIGRAQTILNNYLSRCAPFPIDSEDPELIKFSSPSLMVTEMMTFETGRSKLGFHKVLEHQKVRPKLDLDESDMLFRPDLDAKDESFLNGAELKVEKCFSDFEDEMPLVELRENKSMELEDFHDDSDYEVEAKKKKKKESKPKKKKSPKLIDENLDSDTKKKSTIRKPLELDPEKIKIITLNPEEQIKQREEESKAGLKFVYQCKLCFKGFNFEFKLENHMTKHSPARGKYKCDICTMYLPTPYSYSVHSLIHTRRYECLKCGIRMIDRLSIYNHYRKQHEGITTLIKCDICGKISSNQKTHRSHMRNHHSGERPRCDQCGNTFVNRDSLTEHMLIHNGVKNYECSTCGRKCRSRAHLKAHMVSHSNTRDYYCVECDVRFKTPYNLKHHLVHSSKHRDEKEFKFPCPLCPRRLRSVRALAAHARAHAPHSHACGACGAALSSRAALRKHTRHVHQGARPAASHVCHTCGKAFSGKSVLMNHIRTHTGEKPFACAACGRRFTQRTALATHHKLVHLKIKRNAKPKLEIIEQPAPPTEPCKEKDKMQVVYDSWGRPCDLFYVTSGP